MRVGWGEKEGTCRWIIYFFPIFFPHFSFPIPPPPCRFLCIHIHEAKLVYNTSPDSTPPHSTTYSTPLASARTVRTLLRSTRRTRGLPRVHHGAGGWTSRYTAQIHACLVPPAPAARASGCQPAGYA